jgi:hypothetical protein
LNQSILHSDVQNFIQGNLHTDTNLLLLTKSPFRDVSSRELAEQIDSKKRCEKKLPLWFSTPGIYYPPKLSIEQASSEVTAKFKGTLVKGKTLLDLTGGFGVDSYYFAKSGMQVLHSEINLELADIAEYDSKVLRAGNIHFYKGDGLDQLTSGKGFDTIFVDPSRRVNTQKVFKLKDCEPDIPQNLQTLLRSCSRLLIKTSPLLDLQAGLLELGNVKEIYIVSVKNDCKELIWVLEPDNNTPEPEIICHTFNDAEQEYRFKMSEERSLRLTDFSDPLKFLYEPDVALLKAGCFKSISRDYKLNKLHPNSHLYTSEELHTDFIGRKFLIDQASDYKTFTKTNKLHKANIISRNFPLNPQEIKKKHQIKDGGDDFLIFTTGSSAQLLAVRCQKIQP